MGLQGETNPTTNQDEINQLKQWILQLPTERIQNMSNKDRVQLIRHGIKDLRLPKRHLRHAVTIATTVFGKDSKLLDLPGDVFMIFSRYFRALEDAWHRSSVKTQRTYFLNYRYVILEMCRKWNVDSTQLLCIKNASLLKKQQHMYTQLVQELKKRQCTVKNKNVNFIF
jgi:hypothetical protein